MFDLVLLPLFACVCTCSIDEVADAPAAEILAYCILTFGEKHYVADVRSVIDLLAVHVPQANVHLGCELTRLSFAGSADDSGATTPTSESSASPALPRQLEIGTSDGRVHIFDDVVFASQANHARVLLRSFAKSLDAGGYDPAIIAAEQERVAALDAFSYTRTLVVNHTDSSVLPPRRADRRDLNIVLADPSLPPTPPSPTHLDRRTHVQATHIISRTRSNMRSDLLQTTNPTQPIASDKIVSSVWLERALLTVESRRALRRFRLRRHEGQGDLQGLHGIWFAGSWCADGVPLLESAVVSAERVVRDGLIPAALASR